MRKYLVTGLFIFCLAGGISLTGQEVSDDPVDTTWYVPGDVNYNLLIAAYLGRDDDVLRFLNQGAYINTTTMSGNSPLLLAAGEGNLSTVRLLLLNEADIRQDNSEGIFPLLQATLNNRIDVAEFLIEKGADVNRSDNSGRTPLLVASAYNFSGLADLLIYYNADVNLPDKQGTTPLLAAVYAGNIGLAQLLVDTGASVNQQDKKGFSPLLVATQMHDTAFVRFLREHKADPFTRNNAGYSAFLIAVAEGDLFFTRYYLELDTAGQYKNDLPVSPVELARRNNNREMIKLLQEYDFKRIFQLYFSSFGITVPAMLNTRDLFTGFETGITEGYTGIKTSAGFMLRPAPVRILQQESDNYYYQFWEKRYMFYGEFSRNFFLVGNNDKTGGGLSLSLRGGYTFGPVYAGSTRQPAGMFFLSPGAGIFYQQYFWQIHLAYNYLDLHTLRIYPHYISFGINLFFNLKTISPPRKTITWY